MRKLILCMMALAVMAGSLAMSYGSTGKYEMLFNREDVEACAKMLYIEQGYGPAEAMEACVLTACYRVDAGLYESVAEAIRAPYQYEGYKAYHPVRDDLVEISINTLVKWSLSKQGLEMPLAITEDFQWFSGDGKVNTFRNAYEMQNATEYIRFEGE